MKLQFTSAHWLQMQVAKVGNELLHHPLLRHNNMATYLQRFTLSYGCRFVAVLPHVFLLLNADIFTRVRKAEAVNLGEVISVIFASQVS